MRITTNALALLVPILCATAAHAETSVIHSRYAISALGLPVGVSKFETRISPGSYSMTGTLKASGLVALFKPTTGSMSVSGRFGRNGVQAERFALDYVSGGDRQTTDIGFSGGNVTSAVNKPKVKKRKGWIEVDAAHLRNTVDPISAMLVKADTPGAVCDRTVRVFDGAMRSDIRLNFLRTERFSADGYSGDVVTCRAKFLPVSGYPGGKKEIAWLRDKGRIVVAFAPIEGTDLYAPVKATVSTQLGPVRIYATRLERRME
ncbi:DUF3108 domain-containing protein [Oricola indica]|uniref:DUF3108 domain-containing protein n=1 Tax=Oricola indica TaxID=2872591 RepID=UPI003CCB8352